MLLAAGRLISDSGLPGGREIVDEASGEMGGQSPEQEHMYAADMAVNSAGNALVCFSHEETCHSFILGVHAP